MRLPRSTLAACLIGTLAMSAAGCGSSGQAAIRVPTATAPTGQTAGTPESRAALRGLHQFSITVQGRSRTYILYVPSAASAAHPPALVLVYHGAGGTAQGMLSQTDLLARDETKHDMVLAYLQGYEDSWNEGAGGTPARRAGYDDVAFTAAVLHQVESELTVNRHEVLATGISNGALLTELLGCRIAGSLSAIVPVEGQLPASVSPGCRPARPISVFEIHGTADPAIPYGGGHFDGLGGGTTVLSAPASVARWGHLDDCTRRSPTTTSGSMTITGYAGCRGSVLVRLDTIQSGQHVWPPSFGELIAHVLGQLPASAR